MDFHLTLTMPSHSRFLRVVRAVIDELGLVYGFPDELCRGLTLAVDEAMANIIRHAYKGRYDQKVVFNCDVDADRMEFTLLDWGEAPDMARICAQPLDDVSLGGRGTHLIKAVMDEVSYERVPGGNRLRMIKHLPAAKVNAGKE